MKAQLKMDSNIVQVHDNKEYISITHQQYGEEVTILFNQQQLKDYITLLQSFVKP